jgi:hypothetical protein
VVDREHVLTNKSNCVGVVVCVGKPRRLRGRWTCIATRGCATSDTSTRYKHYTLHLHTQAHYAKPPLSEKQGNLLVSLLEGLWWSE